MKKLPSHIDNYKEPEMLEKYSNKYNLSSSEAKKHFKETKRFLWLCAKTDKPLTPSSIVDQLWHEFIIHTKNYAHFCKQELGFFVHHIPLELPNDEAYKRTRELIKLNFGKINIKIWPNMDSSSCGDAGACSDCQAIVDY